MSINQEVNDISTNAFNMAEIATVTTLLKAKSVHAEMDGTHAIYVAIQCVGGALKVLAELLSSEDNQEESVHGTATKEAMLAAALITARVVVPWKRGDEHGVMIDFNARNIVAAFEAANLISGEDIKSKLNPPMYKSYQKAAEESGKTLGYWDYIDHIGPQFDGMGHALKSYMKH